MKRIYFFKPACTMRIAPLHAQQPIDLKKDSIGYYGYTSRLGYNPPVLQNTVKELNIII